MYRTISNYILKTVRYENPCNPFYEKSSDNFERFVSQYFTEISIRLSKDNLVTYPEFIEIIDKLEESFKLYDYEILSEL